MINGRNKGAAAEREAANWLKDTFKLEHAPQRNLEQVRSGGYDLEGFHPFAFEIKRCEVLSLRKWWVQAVNQCHKGEIPVVMFRQNTKKWQFLISARYIGNETGYLLLEMHEFTEWAKKAMLT